MVVESDVKRQGPDAMHAPARQLPVKLARITEMICVCGLMLSAGAIIVGALASTATGAKVALAGIAGVFVFCFVPIWIVGTYDATRAGQHASRADLARWEFGATWGMWAYVAHYVWRRKKHRQDHVGKNAG